ncbi:unnamed protein product [Pleuronectes platessa]|uniref:Uncharacterized protein n=1 Tax=Pleuronectes platessa TaxID=8262 RepID=A0A9N7Z4W3_PLEPL|nr:unnamed protein product [Pleuronectes platessa]
MRCGGWRQKIIVRTSKKNKNLTKGDKMHRHSESAQPMTECLRRLYCTTCRDIKMKNDGGRGVKSVAMCLWCLWW